VALSRVLHHPYSPYHITKHHSLKRYSTGAIFFT